MNRPKNNKIRRPQFLCIVGCEGKNQERIYFDKVAELVNCVEERTHDLVFDYAEPYGGNPKCVVERTIQKSIGKERMQLKGVKKYQRIIRVKRQIKRQKKTDIMIIQIRKCMCCYNFYLRK